MGPHEESVQHLRERGEGGHERSCRESPSTLQCNPAISSDIILGHLHAEPSAILAFKHAEHGVASVAQQRANFAIMESKWELNKWSTPH